MDALLAGEASAAEGQGMVEEGDFVAMKGGKGVGGAGGVMSSKALARAQEIVGDSEEEEDEDEEDEEEDEDM